jgi:flagellar basal body rod protein FlgC
MIQALNISAAGMQHQAQRLRASAHNTANATTPTEESARLRVRGQERADGVASYIRCRVIYRDGCDERCGARRGDSD